MAQNLKSQKPQKWLLRNWKFKLWTFIVAMILGSNQKKTLFKTQHYKGNKTYLLIANQDTVYDNFK